MLTLGSSDSETKNKWKITFYFLLHFLVWIFNFARWKILTLKFVILFLINVINYMDRYVLFGIVSSIQNEFQIGKAQIGLLQTVFIISYMIFSPLAGYFGDRYDRKIILGLSLISWSVVVFWSRLILNEFIIWLIHLEKSGKKIKLWSFLFCLI